DAAARDGRGESRYGACRGDHGAGAPGAHGRLGASGARGDRSGKRVRAARVRAASRGHPIDSPHLGPDSVTSRRHQPITTGSMFGIPGRRLLAILAFVLWFGAVGEHVRREYFKPLETRLAEATRRLDPATYFYAVRLDGRTIGLATSRLDTVPGGFVLEERLVLDLPAVGKVERAVMSTTAELGPALDVRRFAFDLTSAGSQFGVRGTVRDGTTLDLEIRTGGKTERSEVDAGSGALLAALAPLRLAAAGGLETGREHRLAIFDPSLLATREVMLRVGERDRLLVPDSVDLDAARREWIPARYDTVPVWRIEESYGGIKVSSWVDPDGRLVKAESPIGFVVERTEYELAQQELARTRSEPG